MLARLIACSLQSRPQLCLRWPTIHPRARNVPLRPRRLPRARPSRLVVPASSTCSCDQVATARLTGGRRLCRHHQSHTVLPSEWTSRDHKCRVYLHAVCIRGYGARPHSHFATRGSVAPVCPLGRCTPVARRRFGCAWSRERGTQRGHFQMPRARLSCFPRHMKHPGWQSTRARLSYSQANEINGV